MKRCILQCGWHLARLSRCGTYMCWEELFTEPLLHFQEKKLTALLYRMCKSDTHFCNQHSPANSKPARLALNALKQDLFATRLIPRFCEHENKQLYFAPSLMKLTGRTFIIESICLKTNLAPDLQYSASVSLTQESTTFSTIFCRCCS